MIVKRGGGYHVVSEGGKNLGGPYKSRKAARRRLRQVEYFKHRGKSASMSVNQPMSTWVNEFGVALSTNQPRDKRGRFTYSVGVHKAYFPKHLHPKGVGQEYIEVHKVEASTRAEAARKVWAEHKDRLIGMMNPPNRLGRKVSLYVNEPSAGVGGKLGRLIPILVHDEGASASLEDFKREVGVLHACLAEAGDDAEAGLLAAEYILSTSHDVSGEERDEGGKWTESPSPDAEDNREQKNKMTGRIGRWLKAAAKFPKRMVSYASSKAAQAYHKLEGKYGPKWAKAIVAVGIVTFPTPFTTGAVLATCGVAKLSIKLFGGGPALAIEAGMSRKRLRKLGRRFMQGLAADLENAALSTDAAGHEHGEVGSGHGGQFVGKPVHPGSHKLLLKHGFKHVRNQYAQKNLKQVGTTQQPDMGHYSHSSGKSAKVDSWGRWTVRHGSAKFATGKGKEELEKHLKEEFVLSLSTDAAGHEHRGKGVGMAFSYDIHNRKAQGILNRALDAARKLSAGAKKELQAAVKATNSGEAILRFLDKYRVGLAKVLHQTQLASLLAGAVEVAGKVPPLATFAGAVPLPPTLEPGEAVRLVDELEALPDDARARAIYELPPDQQQYVQQALAVKGAGPPEVPPTFTPPAPPAGQPEEVHYPTIEAAARNLAERNVMDRQKFDALDAAARAKAFTVANVAAEETLTKIRDSLAQNVKEGVDYETWAEKVAEDVDSGTFLSEAHRENVFRTNVQSAFSDGQMEVLKNPLVRSGFPYVARDAIHDDRVRHDHLELEKLGIQGTNIYRVDDPVWQLFRAPWDYNDRCSDTFMTVRQAAEAGIEEAKTWLETGVEPAEKAHVKMPDFAPPPGFQRDVQAAPLSVQLSMQSITSFSVELALKTDVVLKKRYGKKPGPNWTPGGFTSKGTQIWLWNPPEGSDQTEPELEQPVEPAPGPEPATPEPEPDVVAPAPSDDLVAAAGLATTHPHISIFDHPTTGEKKLAIKVPKGSSEGLALQGIGANYSNSKGNYTIPVSKVEQVKAALEKADPETYGKVWPKAGDIGEGEPLGGSTGAELIEHNGKKYVKKTGASANHIEAEYTADTVYQALGIAVPKAKLYQTDPPTKLAEYIEGGKTLDEYLKSQKTVAPFEKVRKELQKGFVMDALLGNWDVVGLNKDNIIVDGNGKVWRIDNGGSLDHRAQGGKKTADQWSSQVTELDSMRDVAINPSAAMIFGSMTDSEIRAQVEDVLTKRDVILDALPDKYKKIMGERLDFLRKRYPVKVEDFVQSGKTFLTTKISDEYEPSEEDAGHVAFKALSDHDERVGFDAGDAPGSLKAYAKKMKDRTPKELIDAARKYTNGGYAQLNKAIQECPDTMDCLSKEHKKWVSDIDSAIAAQGTLKAPINVWRGIQVDSDVVKKYIAAFDAAMLSGATIQMPGVKSCSTSFRSGNVTFEIRARTGIYAQPFSHHSGENEWLQGTRAKYKVTGIKEVTAKHGKTKVIQLEEVL